SKRDWSSDVCSSDLGPTVVSPLLRQARLNKETASLLKWEGIVNDPVGVLLAVLAVQYFTISPADLSEIFWGLGKAIGVALVLGEIGRASCRERVAAI